VPDLHLVQPRGNIRNYDQSPAIGDSVIWGPQGNDDGAHFGMDVAKDVADSLTVEDNVPATTTLVKTQIEPLPLEKRKDIVKERILIREFDGRPDRNDQQMGRKTLGLLQKLRAFPSRRFINPC